MNQNNLDNHPGLVLVVMAPHLSPLHLVVLPQYGAMFPDSFLYIIRRIMTHYWTLVKSPRFNSSVSLFLFNQPRCCQFSIAMGSHYFFASLLTAPKRIPDRKYFISKSLFSLSHKKLFCKNELLFWKSQRERFFSPSIMLLFRLWNKPRSHK